MAPLWPHCAASAASRTLGSYAIGIQMSRAEQLQLEQLQQLQFAIPHARLHARLLRMQHAHIGCQDGP